jgi:hypothetical protein
MNPDSKIRDNLIPHVFLEKLKRDITNMLIVVAD